MSRKLKKYQLVEVIVVDDDQEAFKVIHEEVGNEKMQQWLNENVESLEAKLTYRIISVSREFTVEETVTKRIK